MVADETLDVTWQATQQPAAHEAVSAEAPRTGWQWAGWTIAVALSLALMVVAEVWQLGKPPLAGQQEHQPAVGFIAGILEWLALLAAIATLGSLLAAALSYRHPDRGVRWRLTGQQYRFLTSAARWSLTWGLCCLVLVLFNAADSNGVPVSYVLHGLGSMLVATQSAQAWLATAVVALAIALGCWLARSWQLVIGMVVLGLLATLPTVVTAQVSVGANHDLATDAAILFTLATAWWFATTWAAVRVETARHPVADSTDDSPAGLSTAAIVLRRARWAGLVGVIVAIPAWVGIGAFEQAGQAPWKSAYGWAVLALLFVLVVLAVRVGLRRRPSALDGSPSRSSMSGDLALIILVIGLQAAMWRIYPHRYVVPQTAVQNFLGYNVAKPPPLGGFFLPGRPNLLLTVITVAAVGLYLWGMWRVHRAGNHWPGGRLAAWLIGWAMMVVLLDSQMWKYSSATFGWHMVVHMTVNMGAPVLMVLGAPITLLFRSTKATQPGRPVGIRDAASEFLEWGPVQFLLNPILVWLLFVGSLYVLYLTPLFGTAMRYHWAHQLMIVHFLVTGYLFNWLVVGTDRAPRPLPYVARLGYVFAAMPFHAFFAVALLAGGTITGANFFRSLNLSWLHNLVHQQQIGGQITWATGEIPLFVVIIALVWQWFREDQREARRKDRAIDSGRDDSLEAYNQMLAALAERDRRSAARQPSAPSDERRPVTEPAEHQKGGDGTP
jgi:putative copper resistance protein D